MLYRVGLVKNLGWSLKTEYENLDHWSQDSGLFRNFLCDREQDLLFVTVSTLTPELRLQILRL